MSSKRPALRRLAVAALLAAAVAGCEHQFLFSLPRTSVNQTLFKSYVALGNSITAGFQSAGIVDSTQRESYAAIIAHKAGTRYAYASFRFPGCPPPVVDFKTGATLGGPGAPLCALRDPASVTAVLNNVAVPGAAAIDPTSPVSGDDNPLFTFILGGKTQVQRALDAHPSFVSIWIGNNDVLTAALGGFALGQPTPVDTFAARYDAMMSQLTTGAKGVKGILIAVVNVTSIPALFPVQNLISDPMYKAEFNAAVTGNPATNVPVAANCNNSGALVSLEIIPALRRGVIPGVSCNTGDPFTLNALKQGAISQSVAAYNAHIAQAAQTAGFAFVVNPILDTLKAHGQIAARPDFTSATNPFGPFFSLDGVHPSALAHQYVANVLIQAINAKYSVSIDTVAHQ